MSKTRKISICIALLMATFVMGCPGNEVFLIGEVRDKTTGKLLAGVEVWETDFWGTYADSVDCSNSQGKYFVYLGEDGPDSDLVLRFVKSGYLVEHRKGIHSDKIGDHEYRMPDVTLTSIVEQSN